MKFIILTNVSWIKLFIDHNVDIKSQDLRLNLYNMIFPWDDESRSDVKAPCNSYKKRGVLHSPQLNCTHVPVRVLLFPTQS